MPNYQEPKLNQHTHSFSSTRSPQQMDEGGLARLARGVKNWGPDLLALPGDIWDALAYSGRKIAQGQFNRPVPSQGAGEAIRRWATKSKPRETTELSASYEETGPETAARLLNPLFAMSPLKALALAAGISPGAVEGATPLMAGVVKEKGGNWLSGSVEGALSGLKKRMNPELEGYARRGQNLMPHEASDVLPKIAVNNFIDKQLTKYVKNEMATPEDPIRALAERGVLHFTPEPSSGELWPGREIASKRISGLAPDWEEAADRVINVDSAGSLLHPSSIVSRSDLSWLEKVPSKTPVYSTDYMSRDLGFNHLIDELSNAINPESGLPRHLQFPADRLDKVSVPQAVERVAKINEWRKAQKAEADAKLANNAATVLYKEYPDKGMKWVELRPAEQLNPEYELKQIQGKNGSYWDLRKPGAPYGHTTNTELEAIRASNREALEQALKYEGGTMGHCVGGYCDDVLGGRSRIYSLRDAKGQPHVTIEVQPKSETEFLRERWKDYADIKQEGQDFAHRWITQELAKQPQRIIQIKGKGNAKPIDEYLPFVQDFVRSGQWSDVGDLQNAGLRNLVTLGDEPMVRAARERLGNYATDAEWDAFSNEYLRSRQRRTRSPRFSAGG